MPKKYPLEFKKQAIRRYEKGESIPALCQELHISQSTFYHWRNQYRSIQTSAHTYTPAEFDVLVRRLQKAEHKLSIIQLSGYLSKVPLQDKLATLEHNAVAETFFATFKKEETYRREYTSERHFRKSVDKYIRFYNEVRPHQTLKYKTPQAFEATYQSSYIEKPCSYNDAGV